MVWIAKRGLEPAGDCDGSELIASVEFGNEIAHGKGRTVIEKYSLDIG
jgi:hypothetical protein